MDKPLGTILWVDDEIDNLTAHITFLSKKGYAVEPVSGGADALDLLRRQAVDLVFLDENMPGMGGLETLAEIKKLRPSLPVVMITKNEAESLMEEAIGRQIADFLIKPVNPNQILLSLKKILDTSRITHEVTSRDYLQSANRINQDIDLASSAEDWLNLFVSLTRWELAMESVQDESIRQLMSDQKKQANLRFIRFIEDNYRKWLPMKAGERPLLSVDIIGQVLAPLVQKQAPVFYLVIDCLRSDQWMEFEKLLADYFEADTRYYFSILPTATPYSRNSLFSGLFPSEIENKFPDLWTYSVDSEESLNAHEAELFRSWFRQKNIRLNQDPKYYKINTQNDTRNLDQSFGNLVKNDLTAVVVNFVDMVSHARSEMGILKELAPDEKAYRSLSASWFENSFLKELLVNLSKSGVRVVVTSDHGAVLCNRGTRVNADRETSTNLRYKYGRNLNVDPRDAIVIRNPNEYRLPKYAGNTNYLIAKQDVILLYPNNYNHYQNQFRDTFQHGGVSMEEMIVPVSVLTPKFRG